MALEGTNRYVMARLLAGWDWFDGGLQNAVRSAGYQTLNKTQSMMVLYVFSGVQRPIEIARRMRLSRQAIGHISTQLIDMGILKAEPDPTDGRSIVLSFTKSSTNLRAFAERTILGLERVLEQRIGKRRFAMLLEVLELDWGEIIGDMNDIGLGRWARTATRKRAKRAVRSRGD